MVANIDDQASGKPDRVVIIAMVANKEMFYQTIRLF